MLMVVFCGQSHGQKSAISPRIGIAKHIAQTIRTIQTTTSNVIMSASDHVEAGVAR